MKIMDGAHPQNTYPAIEVRLWPSPNDPKVTVATVSLFEFQESTPSGRLKVTDFIQRKRMTRDAAVAIASKEAKARNIDTIYVQAT